MDERERLEPYYFHEKGFETLAEAEEYFEWEVPDSFNIAEYVCDRWADDGDRTALYVGGDGGGTRSYSFADLRDEANRFANFLADRGVGVGDRIAVNGTQRLESLVAHLAAFKLGAVSVPLSVLLGSEGLRYRLDDSEACAFVVDRAAAETLAAVREDLDDLDLVVTNDDFARGDQVAFCDAVDGRSDRFETLETDAEDPSCVIYTSGTTGQPKGAVHAHRHVLGELPQFVSLQGHRTGAGEVTRTISEWSWIMSLNGVVLPALFYGGAVAACPAGKFDPEREFGLVETFGVTHLNLPPTAVRMMMAVDSPAERWDLSSVHTFITGGESAGERIIQWVADVFDDAAFIEGYGSTEIGGLISDDPAYGVDHRIGYLGVPSLGHEVAVVDPETMEPIEEPDVIGELVVRFEGDPMLFVEYLDEPEKTAEKIQNGWLRSEDLVSVDEDGYVKFHARDDDLIISSGYRFGPDEIEEALVAHEAVSDAGVIGVPHETRGEIPKAYVVLHDGYEASDDLRADLQAFVKGRLAKYEYPREIEFVRSLPTTSTGKVQRATLRERDDDGET